MSKTSESMARALGHPVQMIEEDRRERLLSFEEITLSDYVYTLQESMSEEPLYNAVKDGNLERVITLIERPGK